MKKLVLLLCASISFTSYGMKPVVQNSIDRAVGIVTEMKWQIENNSPEPRTPPDEDYANARHNYVQMILAFQAKFNDSEERNQMEAELRRFDAIDQKRVLQLLHDIESIDKKLGIKYEPGRENEIGNWMRGILNQAPIAGLISSRNGRKVIAIVAIAAICYGIYRGYQWWKNDQNKKYSPKPC